MRSAGKFGFRIYFGDGARKDVLEASGIRRAKVVAVCTNKRADHRPHRRPDPERVPGGEALCPLL